MKITPIPPGTLTARLAVDGNFLDKLSEQGLAGREAALGEVQPSMLADITPVVGTVQDITVVAPESFAQDVKFVTEDGTLLAVLDAGWIASSLSGIAVKAYARSSSEKGYIALVAYNSDGSAYSNLQMRHDGLFTIRNLPIKYGTQETYRKVADSAEQAVAFTTIPANAMGANGRVHMRVEVLIKNNKGSAGTYTLTGYFGTKSFNVNAATTVNDSATTRSTAVVDIEVRNLGATNSQEIIVTKLIGSNYAAESFTTPIVSQEWATAAIDTTAAVDFKLNITLSATHASFFAESSGEFSGAYGVVS